MIEEFAVGAEKEMEARRHEELARLHAGTARLLRERDSLVSDNAFLRSQWDAAMRLLEIVGSRVELSQDDVAPSAERVGAEWAVENIDAVFSLLRIWRADIERVF